MPAVSNTSPLSNLACIGRLKLLQQQFHEVWIPDAVDKELHNIPDPPARKAIEEAKHVGWLKPRSATNTNLVNLLMVELHQGKAEAIALALEMKANRLLIEPNDGSATGVATDGSARRASPRKKDETDQTDQT